MVKNKTMYTAESVLDFIENLEHAQKREDSYDLVKLMESVSGEGARMFGPSIIGFGKYHYTYASGHEGEAPLIGFSPRKAAISLYVFTGWEGHAPLLEDLGKFKLGKACIYIKKLEDIQEEALIKLMEATIDFLSNRYTRIEP
ncbi:DUF1801 domain-containing protein [Sphingobacterium sp. SGG-5]|nr:DUF1801 domain-containing protein [Sphingobacterium sp. SGG-5]